MGSYPGAIARHRPGARMAALGSGISTGAAVDAVPARGTRGIGCAGGRRAVLAAPRDTRNGVPPRMRLCPTACPIGLQFLMTKPNMAGIVESACRGFESLLRHGKFLQMSAFCAGATSRTASACRIGWGSTWHWACSRASPADMVLSPRRVCPPAGVPRDMSRVPLVRSEHPRRLPRPTTCIHVRSEECREGGWCAALVSDRMRSVGNGSRAQTGVRRRPRSSERTGRRR